ncbi:G-protein coupled receptor 143-like [Thrips palmi]|uniref:G-protein coupled receptor 143-like n=1 Tax=Thrips palmi TaxID=161013 RepID=A0A6P8Y532_THRPL|nr:G-protein coupled receptor 143-like [Thrips palmi]
MADPTIQTFCCHQPDKADSSVDIMQAFNSNSYSTVCLISSSIGILGAVYQVLPREEPYLSHRWLTQSVTRGRQMVVWLAVADLLASLGVFIRSALWLNYKSLMNPDSDSTVLFCAIVSAWIQYFYTATWFWTLCYAVDMRLVLRERPGHPVLYHLCCWLIPAVLTSVGLSILYIPNANCHNLKSLGSAVLHILPNYLATYVPMAVVMVANPILYCDVARAVHTAVVCSLAQFTSKERGLVDTVRLKLALINLAFYACWLPNIINGILLWTLWYDLPTNVIISLWYIMAVMNPLQALFNSMVYRRWTGGPDKVYIPCRKLSGRSALNDPLDEDPLRPPVSSESTPLLENPSSKATSGNTNFTMSLTPSTQRRAAASINGAT